MVSKKIQIITSFLIFTQSLYALVGGSIIKDDRIVRLSKCTDINSRTQGTNHGCRDNNIATGSFISAKEILTAGHFAAHFIFQKTTDYLKVITDGKEVKLVFKRDFIIHMPYSYYSYEKQTRNETIKSKSPIKTCMEDIAVIELTKFGARKILGYNYLKLNTSTKTNLEAEVEMYGYGVYKFEIYNTKKRTFNSVLSWVLSLGESSSKTWIKVKEIDNQLRLGKNQLRRASKALKGLKLNFKVDTSLLAVKANMLSANYYKSYFASGDSGGPVIMNGEVIGIACSIKSIHYSDYSIDLVSIITPTFSKKLTRFWQKDRKTIK